jgi:hypothetical protein
MSETVKADILNEGAKRAIHTTYKNLMRALIAMGAGTLLSIAVASAGLVTLWNQRESDCRQRQERTETTRGVWNAVFDELEKLGADDVTLDRLQTVVDTELPPVEC